MMSVSTERGSDQDVSEDVTCTDGRVDSVGASARRLRESHRVGQVARTFDA
jgi:hypothetical protein